MKDFMRHDKDVVLNALDYLQSFDDSKQYQDNFKITIEYIEDLIQLSEHYKGEAEKSIASMKSVLTQMMNAVGKLPQDHKKKVRK